MGTVFAPVKARGSSRRLWIGFAADPRGTIVVDAGAGQAIRGGRASLLAAGALEVHGDFSAGDPVWIDAESGEHLARGLAGFDSEEIPQMLGVTPPNSSVSSAPSTPTHWFIATISCSCD